MKNLTMKKFFQVAIKVVTFVIKVATDCVRIGEQLLTLLVKIEALC